MKKKVYNLDRSLQSWNMENDIKLGAFLFFIQSLVRRFAEISISVEKLSRISILKLLFFTVLINQKQRRENPKVYNLLDVFDHFYALPLGPVESDCYDLISGFVLAEDNFEKILRKYNGNFKGVAGFQNKIDSFDRFPESKNIEMAIDEAINAIPESVLRLTPSQMVFKSHAFESWKKAFGQASAWGRKSWPMSNDQIASDSNDLSCILS